MCMSVTCMCWISYSEPRVSVPLKVSALDVPRFITGSFLRCSIKLRQKLIESLVSQLLTQRARCSPLLLPQTFPDRELSLICVLGPENYVLR